MQAFITDKEVNIVNEEGCTPLMVAAANGRDEIIRQLLEQEVSVLTGVLKFLTVISGHSYDNIPLPS